MLLVGRASAAGTEIAFPWLASEPKAVRRIYFQRTGRRAGGQLHGEGATRGEHVQDVGT